MDWADTCDNAVTGGEVCADTLQVLSVLAHFTALLLVYRNHISYVMIFIYTNATIYIYRIYADYTIILKFRTRLLDCLSSG